MRLEKVLVALSLLVLPVVALAVVRGDDTSFVPEPETLGLIAGAAVAWAIVHWRKRK